MVATLHSIIVLVRRRGGGCGWLTGMGGRWWGRRGGCSVAQGGRIALGGGVVLGVSVIDEGDVGFRVLYPELRVGHEVVDGAAGFWLLQPLIGRQGATECIHHPDLSLDAVEASEPEDLSSAELPLSVVDLLHLLHVLQLLVGDLHLLGAVARGLQELQTAGGDRRDQLTPEETAEAQEDAPKPLVDG